MPPPAAIVPQDDWQEFQRFRQSQIGTQGFTYPPQRNAMPPPAVIIPQDDWQAFQHYTQSQVGTHGCAYPPQAFMRYQ